MYFTLPLEQFQEECVYFNDPIKNNIMSNSSFVRILYSLPFVTFNGVCLSINVYPLLFTKYYNKHTFCLKHNKQLIASIKSIEEKILSKINIHNKTPRYKIYEQLTLDNIKIYSNYIDKNNHTIVLKISGIWESSNEYGITYKFLTPKCTLF